MTMVALMFKVAAVPFHFWSPDVYEGSPSLVTFMSTMVKVSFLLPFTR
jgi:NADH-quinone oxidoreductase subunit N